MRPNEKRIVFEIDRALHLSVKMAALHQGLSLKAWMIRAIAKQLIEERDQYQNDKEVK